jgi:hypothetical protein
MPFPKIRGFRKLEQFTILFPSYYNFFNFKDDFWFSLSARKFSLIFSNPEAESKEKHGVWDPMPEKWLNLTLRPFQSRLQNI